MWRSVVCAISFLTRIPVPHIELRDADVARSAGFFAWVGGIIAAVLWLSSLAFASLGSRVASLGVVVAWALITGGLHLDGLADTADGLSGGRGDRTRTLEIMRDSRIGSHGATALVLVIALKWTALERAMELHQSAWLLTPVIARLLTTVLLASFPYARERGLGSAFANQVGAREVVLGALALVPCAWIFGASFVVPALLGVLVAAALAWRVSRLLGGLTGDVHGACVETCEAIMLMGLGSLDLLLW